MRQTIRVNEYYDLFDIKTVDGTTSSALTNVPATIKDTQMTNPFRGFSNWDNFNSANPNNTSPITGQIKSAQAQNSLYVDTDGNIWCYPPNVSVPYWTRIVFRNYDYNFSSSPIGKYATFVDTIASKPFNYEIPPTTNYNLSNINVPIPKMLWNQDNSTGTIDSRTQFMQDYSSDGVEGVTLTGIIYDPTNVPLFLRFDEYPSRSKVIFSNCDKTRNPDIDFRFAYHKGQMEPIKLNLSLSADTPVHDPSNPSNIYNQNLKKEDMSNLLLSCYWCIEWIYEPE